MYDAKADKKNVVERTRVRVMNRAPSPRVDRDARFPFSVRVFRFQVIANDTTIRFLSKNLVDDRRLTVPVVLS